MPTVYEALLHEASSQTKTMRDVDNEFKERLQNKWGFYLALAIAALSGFSAHYFFNLQWYYIIAVIVVSLFLSGIAFIRIPTILFDSVIAGMSMLENHILKNTIDKTYSDYTIPTLRLIVVGDDGKDDLVSMRCKPLIDVPRKGDFIHLEGLEFEMTERNDKENIDKLKTNHKEIFQKSYEVIKVTWHPFNKVREVLIIAKDPSIKLDKESA
jgi:hypothetical protein